MSTDLKLAFSGVAVALTLIAFIPYIISILKGVTKPHCFSWVIWGTTTVIVFFAQLNARGGIGAWPIGISGAISILIAALAFVKRSDIAITVTDWVFFVAALSSLPFWFFTADPLWAVVVLTIVDMLGFGPTVRKAYTFPHDENPLFFLLFMLRNTFAILALQHYSLATVLFPLSVAIACAMLLILIFWRRRIIFPHSINFTQKLE